MCIYTDLYIAIRGFRIQLIKDLSRFPIQCSESDISTIHCFIEYLITNAGTGNRQKRGLDFRLPGSVQNLYELLR